MVVLNNVEFKAGRLADAGCNLLKSWAGRLAELIWCPKVNKGPWLQPVLIDFMLITLFTE